jgi:hypothetical protein
MAGNGHCLPLRKGVKDEFLGHAFLVEGMPFFLIFKWVSERSERQGHKRGKMKVGKKMEARERRAQVLLILI